jgi:hypothetical protein
VTPWLGVQKMNFSAIDEDQDVTRSVELPLPNEEETKTSISVPSNISLDVEPVYRSVAHVLPNEEALGELTPFPTYFQRYSCFSCAQIAHHELWDRFISALENEQKLAQKGLKVKFEKFKATNEVCGIACQGPSTAHFKATLYKCRNEHNEQIDQEHPKENVMIEFQRRSGCHHVFADFRESIRSQVLGCPFRQGLRRAPPLQGSDLFVDETEEDKAKIRREHISEVIGLRQSEYLDQQMEGLQALVSISTNDEYKENLSEKENIDTIKCFLREDLKSRDEEVQMCAALLFQNLRDKQILLDLDGDETVNNVISSLEQEQGNSDVYCRLVRQTSLEILRENRDQLPLAPGIA